MWRNTLIHIRLSISLFFLVGNLSSSAQESGNQIVHYAYDANGNRIKRWVTVEEVPASDSTRLLQNLAFIKAGPVVETDGATVSARLYPNPTPGALELSIPWAGEQTPAEYGCYSLAGAEFFRRKTTTEITEIDISHYPPGSYVVVVFRKERNMVWKVVKY